jgi:signal transduction histidine kinase
MTKITQRISSGDYSMKAPIRSQDEVGQLAVAFNQMAVKLQEIEQLRKNLMVDVAHELRTPLTNMQGYLEALIDGVVKPTEETFKLLENETFRLVQLVEDIFRLTKADAARTTLQKSKIQIDRVINQVLDSFRPQFGAKKISVETDYKNGIKSVDADYNKLTQVIQNLLQNALQYTQKGGTVRIFAEQLPKEVKVIFSNTGGELNEKDLSFIFERFYRGEKSRSREYGGSGIGLAIVKELVEAHDGQVGANLESGETHIWFILPLTR